MKQRWGETQTFHLLIHSPSDCHSQVCTRLKPRSWNSSEYLSHRLPLYQVHHGVLHRQQNSYAPIWDVGWHYKQQLHPLHHNAGSYVVFYLINFCSFVLTQECVHKHKYGKHTHSQLHLLEIKMIHLEFCNGLGQKSI